MRKQIVMVIGLLFMLGSVLIAAASTCSATPQSAIQSRGQAQNTVAADYASGISSEGYRLHHVTIDPVLHRKWAWMENCTHPERPLQVVALPAAAENLSPRNANVSSIDIAHVEPVRPNRIAIGNLVVSSTAIDPSLLSTPWVRAGDRVHLWSSDANVRLEIEVIALEYGRVGQVIHFRRKGQETLLAGIVTGKDSAELMP